MDIKIVGTGCEKCDAMYENTVAALAELGMQVEVQKVEDLIEMVRLGVMSSPALLVNGKVLALGHVLKTKEIVKLLEKV